MKCFVLSLHRSGTLSTARYLSGLGLKTKHWPVEHDGVNLEELVCNRECDLNHVVEVLTPVLESFDAIADLPMPILYRELFTRYPAANFILINRNPKDWVRSIRAHYAKPSKNTNFRPYARTLYWNYFSSRPRRLDDLSDAELMWMHSQHTADVLQFFAQHLPSKLGVFDLYAEDIGNKIASFLELEATKGYPHLNSLD